MTSVLIGSDARFNATAFQQSGRTGLSGSGANVGSRGWHQMMFGRQSAGEAFQPSRSGLIKAISPMKDLSVIPHDDVSNLPVMGIKKTGLGGMGA